MKTLILITFVLMLFSLFAAAGFLLKDDSLAQRVLRSLRWRIGLGLLLVAELLIWFLWLQPE
ncbi:DUF2909 family protein [Bacterioplanoides sp.]|uniref:DUF2909 family protein n=1 Tax=Bacterioplanoides sp. TaxID=2066072 RepID=UPI003AFFE3F9